MVKFIRNTRHRHSSKPCQHFYISCDYYFVVYIITIITSVSQNRPKGIKTVQLMMMIITVTCEYTCMWYSFCYMSQELSAGCVVSVVGLINYKLVMNVCKKVFTVGHVFGSYRKRRTTLSCQPCTYSTAQSLFLETFTNFIQTDTY